MTRVQTWGLVLAAIAIASATTIGSPLFGGELFVGTDILERFDPWTSAAPDLDEVDNAFRGDEVDVKLPARREMAEGVRSGDLPLWQSSVNGGRALAPLPNTGSLSPFALPYYLLPIEHAPVGTKVLELVVMIAGCTALLRRWGTSTEVALFGGFLAAYSGFQIMWTSWSQANLGALIPAMLWAVDRAVDRGTLRSALPLAGITAVAWLEGFPTVTLYGLTLAGAWALYRTRPWRSWRTGVPPLGNLSAAVALGVGLAAFQLWPFVRYFARIDLADRVQTAADDLPIGTLLTSVLPSSYGGIETWIGPDNIVEVHAFVGVVALSLALVGLWVSSDRLRGPRGFLTMAAAVCVLLTYVGGPFLRVAQLTPLFRINDVSRLRSVLLLCVALLAALGLQAWLDGGRGARLRTVAVGPLVRTGGAVAVLLVAAVAGGRTVVDAARASGRTADLMGDVAVGAVVLVAVAGLLLLVARRPSAAGLVVVALVAVATVEIVRVTGPTWSRTPDEAFYPSTPAHEFLAEVQGDDRMLATGLAMYPGTTSWYDLRVAAGHAFAYNPWREALEAVDPDVYDRFSPTFPVLAPTVEVAASPVLVRLGVTHVVTDAAVPDLSADVLRLVFDDGVRIYERTDAIGRFRFAAAAEVVTDPSERLARLADGDVAPDTVLLSTPPAATPTADASTTGDASVAPVVADGDHLVVDVDGPAGWLVVADSLQDDWRAYVNGVEAPLEDADHVGVAVALDAGTHRVELRYDPSGWDEGRLVSLLSVLAVVAIVVLPTRGRRDAQAVSDT